MSYGEQTRNPYENDESDLIEDGQHSYPCACGNPSCRADDRDAGNYRIRGEWYASDCELAKFHPDVVGKVIAQVLSDEHQDAVNQVRR